MIRIEAEFGVQPARLGAQLQGADAGRVVQVDGRVAQRIGGLHEQAPFFIAQIARRRRWLSMPVSPLTRRCTICFVGHFQREDRDPLVELARGIQRDGEHQRGLAHAGPRGDDEQIRALQAAQQLVEVEEPRRDAQRLAAMLVQIFDVIEVVADRLADGQHVHARYVAG